MSLAPPSGSWLPVEVTYSRLGANGTSPPAPTSNMDDQAQSAPLAPKAFRRALNLHSWLRATPVPVQQLKRPFLMEREVGRKKYPNVVDGVHIRFHQLGNPDFDFIRAIAGLIEWYINQTLAITEEDIQAFEDANMRATEPATQPEAPNYISWRVSNVFAHALADMLDVKWPKYLNAVDKAGIEMEKTLTSSNKRQVAEGEVLWDRMVQRLEVQQRRHLHEIRGWTTALERINRQRMMRELVAPPTRTSETPALSVSEEEPTRVGKRKVSKRVLRSRTKKVQGKRLTLTPLVQLAPKVRKRKRKGKRAASPIRSMPTGAKLSVFASEPRNSLVLSRRKSLPSLPQVDPGRKLSALNSRSPYPQGQRVQPSRTTP